MNFSVIIPCYNAGYRIAETLDSVMSQHLKPYEVIVVDDGSNDDSPERAATHPVVTHHLKSNRLGPAGARNVGLNTATGDAIAFIDADDIWRPNHLESAARLLSHDQTVACASNCDLLFESTGTIVKRPNLYNLREPTANLSHDDFLTFFSDSGHFCQPSVVVKRPHIGKGYDESLWGTEDIEFFMRVIYNKQWGYNPASTVLYRSDTPGSVSKANVRQTLNVVMAMRKALDLGYQSETMQCLYQRSCRAAIVAALTYGDRSEVDATWKLAGNGLSTRDKSIFYLWRTIPLPFRQVSRLRHRFLAWRGSARLRNINVT